MKIGRNEPDLTLNHLFLSFLTSTLENLHHFAMILTWFSIWHDIELHHLDPITRLPITVLSKGFPASNIRQCAPADNLAIAATHGNPFGC
ncbi:hypothetical protein Y1Q_0007180 [Alligator mississippiensis]|uniref:Uncharacterized protein n=1 Tax=Alligator mississippiensis TaxID=8496 RepID=A0A151N6P2_ALLMI|nr:hypothetical protein Y1Q_0007180 [Alligator mississippiensis]